VGRCATEHLSALSNLLGDRDKLDYSKLGIEPIRMSVFET